MRTVSRLEDIEGKLLDFVRSEYLEEDASLEVETALFSTGLIDSFSLIALLKYIEEEFGVRLTVANLRDSSCDSIDGLARLVEGTRRQNEI